MPSCDKCEDPDFADMREQWGCDGPSCKSKGGFEYELGDLTLNRCPNALIRHRWTQAAITLFSAFEVGALPKEGGVNQQTMQFNAVMHMFSNDKNRAESWYQEVLKEGSKTEDG